MKLTKNKKEKKSQLAVLSVFLFGVVLIFIYSIETPNTFNIQPSYIYIIDSIELKFCTHTENSPQGLILLNSLGDFENKMEQYCTATFIDCEINTYIHTMPPDDNLSLLTFSNIRMNYSFESSNFQFNKNEVRC